MKYTANLRMIFYSANSKAKKHGNKWGIIIGSVVNNARALKGQKHSMLHNSFNASAPFHAFIYATKKPPTFTGKRTMTK